MHTHKFSPLENVSMQAHRPPSPYYLETIKWRSIANTVRYCTLKTTGCILLSSQSSFETETNKPGWSQTLGIHVTQGDSQLPVAEISHRTRYFTGIKSQDHNFQFVSSLFSKQTFRIHFASWEVSSGLLRVVFCLIWSIRTLQENTQNGESSHPKEVIMSFSSLPCTIQREYITEDKQHMRTLRPLENSHKAMTSKDVY